MVDENTLGREPITIVEIDQDFCNLTYSNSPCTASLGVTGDFKCYNTRTTCQDPNNYDRGSLTLRFCTKTSSFPSPNETELYLPMVEKVTTNSTMLNISNGSRDSEPLGRRSSVTITMRDAPYNDARVDKYLADRGFDPLERSTFWKKFLARNQFYINRILRVRDGYIGQNVSSMRTRTYVIDKISGVDSNGRVIVTAKDVLKLAEDKRAKAPIASTGVLLEDITDVATTATLSPEGIGDEEYPASGKVRMNDEIISFTRVGDVLTLTRAQNNTEADEHDEGDTVQLALVYENEPVADLAYDLLVTYGNIDASYINLSEWQQEGEEWLAGADLDAVITEPEGVTTLLSELTEQVGFFIWWDDVNQKIEFRAVKPVNQDTVTSITEDNAIISESFSITRKPDERVSRVEFYYDQIDPTEKLNEVRNYRTLLLSVDLTKESENQYQESRYRTIFSRWLDGQNAAEALNGASRIIAAYKDTPEYYQFDLDAKNRSLDIADVVEITHRSIVDSQGDLIVLRAQIISREEIESGHRIRYKAQKFGFIGRFAFVMPDSANDFPDATEEEIDTGGYISDANGLMSDGSEGYKII